MRPIKLTKICWLIFIGLVLVGGLFIYFFADQNLSTYRLADTILKVEQVTSNQDLARGLSGRLEMCPNCAMLFTFPKNGSYAFWMKDMLFPIDLIWLENSQVVSCQTLPLFYGPGDLPRYWPPRPINQVLELNKGFCEAHGLKPGASLIRLD